GIQDVALADPGPLYDPGVGGVDHLLQVVVGQLARRHTSAGPDDAASHDTMPPDDVVVGDEGSSAHRKAGEATDSVRARLTSSWAKLRATRTAFLMALASEPP